MCRVAAITSVTAAASAKYPGIVVAPLILGTIAGAHPPTHPPPLPPTLHPKPTSLKHQPFVPDPPPLTPTLHPKPTSLNTNPSSQTHLP
eukprot:1175704-Prorocentrum_minimum.AAC.1